MIRPWLIALVLWGAAAAAQDSYHPYPVGERAMGLGGAYTALADDESGAYYNPAGIAYSTGDSLSVSTGFYGMVIGSTDNALGQGTTFSYSTLNLIPTTASSLWHFGNLVIAFNVFTPSNLSLEARADIRDGTSVYQSATDRLIIAGPALAYRFHPRFSIGLAAWASVNTYSSTFHFVDVREQNLAGVNTFATIFNTEESQNVGVLGSLGVRWEPIDTLFLGLSFRSPSAQVYGKGKFFLQISTADRAMGGAGSQFFAQDVATKRMLPGQLNVGLAWSRKRSVGISADVSLHLPDSYEALTGASTTPEKLNLTVNARIGAEWWIKPEYPVRLGFFTDLSPYDTPTIVTDATGRAEASGRDRRDSLGVTISAGKTTEHTSTTLGLVGTMSFIQTTGTDVLGGNYQQFQTTGRQYRIFIVFASAYSF